MQNQFGSRRDFLRTTAIASLASLASRVVHAQSAMPMRPIPSSAEMLPVIGLGSSKVVSEISRNGPEPVARVLESLVEHGGRVVDTWPRNAENDAGFGQVINRPNLVDSLFVTTKIDQVGREAGIAQFDSALRNYGRSQIDLAQIFSLTDLATHWPTLRAFKENGRARYIGVTVSDERLYGQLEEFLNRETPDFIQVNYSVTERGAEERLLPLAMDSGIAVIINRPFMNGAYFQRLEGEPLPSWAADFDCASWAEFSLKYILANTALTCVLTETSNPVHMAENAQAALGPTPNAATRLRMRRFVDAL